jgi:hypothetical protein
MVYAGLVDTATWLVESGSASSDESSEPKPPSPRHTAIAVLRVTLSNSAILLLIPIQKGPNSQLRQQTENGGKIELLARIRAPIQPAIYLAL